MTLKFGHGAPASSRELCLQEASGHGCMSVLSASTVSGPVSRAACAWRFSAGSLLPLFHSDRQALFKGAWIWSVIGSIVFFLEFYRWHVLQVFKSRHDNKHTSSDYVAYIVEGRKRKYLRYDRQYFLLLSN